MKKIVFKTIITTVCVLILLGVAAFGIASLISPRAMMEFTSEIGLEEMSGDFAYREYVRSEDVGCLARAFLISAEAGRDRKADERFDLLYARDDFSAHCEEQDALMRKNAEDETASETEKEMFLTTSYRSYLCGKAACIKYRLKDGSSAEIVAFAVSETKVDYPSLCAASALAGEALAAGDAETAQAVLTALDGAGMREAAVYREIEMLLEEANA